MCSFPLPLAGPTHSCQSLTHFLSDPYLSLSSEAATQTGSSAPESLLHSVSERHWQKTGSQRDTRSQSTSSPSPSALTNISDSSCVPDGSSFPKVGSPKFQLLTYPGPWASSAGSFSLGEIENSCCC